MGPAWRPPAGTAGNRVLVVTLAAPSFDRHAKSKVNGLFPCSVLGHAAEVG